MGDSYMGDRTYELELKIVNYDSEFEIPSRIRT